MRLRPRTALAFTSLVVPVVLTIGGSTGCWGDDTDIGLDAGPGSNTDATMPQPDGGADAPSSPGDGGGDAPADVSSADAPSNDAPGDAPPTDAPSGDGYSLDAADAGPQVLVRVAWFAPPNYPASPLRDAGPDASIQGPVTYDACVAPHGTQSWQGPLLASAGGALSLYDVSAYFPLLPGQYDVRLVIAPAGQTATCGTPDDASDPDASSPPASDFVNLPALAEGQALTVAVTPSYDEANPMNVDVVPLLDETRAATGMVGVRLANVSGNADGTDPLSYGLGGGVIFTPWLTGVTPAQHLAMSAASDAGGASGDDGGLAPTGYVEVPPFVQIDTTLVGTQELASSGSVDAPAGTLLSAFAVPGYPSDGNGPTAGLVLCWDGQPSASSPLLTRCTPATFEDASLFPATQTRFANFVADQGFPAIETCIKYHAQSAFSGPLGEPSGSAFATVTSRYDIHAGFDYDLRVVAAGATDCTTSVTPDTTYSPPAGLARATVAYVGFVAEDAGVVAIDDAGAGNLTSNAFGAIRFPDLTCGETAPAVRVVNVDAENAGPITASFAGGLGWTLSNIPYGSATPPTGGLDACGYLTAPTGNGMLSVDGDAVAYQVSKTTTLDTLYVASSAGAVTVLRCRDALQGSACGRLVP